MMRTHLAKQITFVACSLLSLLLLIPVRGYAMDVFVTVPPQKWVVEMIAKGQGAVNVLVKNGQDPHTFEPTPKQIVALSRAKIWFTMDMPFEEQLIAKVAQVAPDLRIVDMSEGIEKIDLSADADHAHGQNDHHGHEAADPHVWLSPLNLKIMAANAARALSLEDGEKKKNYEQNLAVVQKTLTDLHERLKRQLSPYAGSSFYVFHPSFDYFAREFDLNQKAVEVGGKSPSPRQIATLVAQARKDQVKVIFVQPQFDQKSARTVAAAIGGKVVSWDALAEDVVTSLTVMADKIEQALSNGEAP